MANRIESARSGRSKCTTCNVTIARGEARMTEEVTEAGVPGLITRFYHLRCAAATHPELLHVALNDVRGEVDVDREQLETLIAPAVEREKQRRIAKYEAQRAAIKKPALATDERTVAALAQLAADPSNAETLAIVADQLVMRGDPRGELITVQQTLAKIDKRPALRPTADDDDDDDDDDDAGDEREAAADQATRLATRLEQLLVELALPQLETRDRAEWGIGFIRRLELIAKSRQRLLDLDSLWAHPSLHILTELRITFHAGIESEALAQLATVVRPTVRKLELGDNPEQTLLEVPALLAALPHLDSLTVLGRIQTPLAHPTLARLRFGKSARAGETLATAVALSAAALPNLRELAFEFHEQTFKDWAQHAMTRSRPVSASPMDEYRETHGLDAVDPVLAALAANGVLERLTHLALVGGTLTDAGIATLAKALGGRKLARLDLTATPLPTTARPRLAALCDGLVFTDATPRADGELWVEHANQPTWGRGKILRRFEGKVEIQFPKIGKKVFKADAAFLRFG